MNETSLKTYAGACHCGAVRFRAQLDLAAGASRCNCSICTRTAPTSAMTKPEAFELLTAEGELGRYAWGAKTSTRFFCKTCGVHCFGRGHLAELGGDFVSVNLNCVDGLELTDLKIDHWDGRHDNWHAGPRSTPWPIGG
jgi:hypothetical protein